MGGVTYRDRSEILRSCRKSKDAHLSCRIDSYSISGIFPNAVNNQGKVCPACHRCPTRFFLQTADVEVPCFASRWGGNAMRKLSLPVTGCACAFSGWQVRVQAGRKQGQISRCFATENSCLFFWKVLLWQLKCKPMWNGSLPIWIRADP